MSWDLVYTKQVQKDAQKLASSNSRDQAQALFDIIKINPFQNPPPYEKLVGDWAGAYSRRINIQFISLELNPWQKMMLFFWME